MNNIVDILSDIFEQHADPKKAIEMLRYMRNLFPFYGISKPLRVQIGKPVLQEFRGSVPVKEFID